MAFTKTQPEKESTTYCSEFQNFGHNITRFVFTNTIEGLVATELKAPEEIVTDGAITEEERVEFARILKKACDYYNPDKE